MKLKAFVFFGTLLGAVFLFIQYGLSIIRTGEAESRWILKEMWGDISFSAEENLMDYDITYIKSLRDASSKDKDVVDYVWREKCRDRSERCHMTMMAAANLMLDLGNYESGLSAATQAFELQREKCPIAFESVALRYKIKKISLMSGDQSRKISTDLIGRIKERGGLLKSLRTNSCQSYIKEKPTFFREYAALISRLMMLAGGDTAKTGAYIESVIESNPGNIK